MNLGLAGRAAARVMALVLTAGALVGVGLLAPVQTAAAAGPATVSRPIDTLARNVDRVESIREVEDVTRSFAQLAQSGRWGDMAALFAPDGTLQWGEQTAAGRTAIAAWLKNDAGAMNGIAPGSLDTMIIDDPIVNLSADGRSARARWDGIRFMGDGKGGTRIDGGVYENDYVQNQGRWQIATLHFYLQYQGNYANGWTNAGGQPLPDVAYHFTPDTAGVPIPAPAGPAPRTTETAAQLAARVSRLNAEDDVRNLQNAYGYYVDRRMWNDVTDLFAPGATVTIAGTGTFHGSNGVRQAMEQTMGPAGLTRGALNDHPIFDGIIDVSPDGKTAVDRGTEIGMLENPATHASSWQFSVFRNTFVNQGGLWKLKQLTVTPLITASYADGWGNGGISPAPRTVPAFLDTSRQAAAGQAGQGQDQPAPNLADLTRRLARSQAYDGAENVNNTYSEYLTDLQFGLLGQLIAQQGNKESPFIGYYVGPARVAQAGLRYGPPPVLRTFIPIHWEPQPVILVSHDGRSANVRARLFQPRTDTDNTGFYQAGFDDGMYNNQAVLENGTWRLWDTTIDEEYFSSRSWATGWAAVQPRDPNLPPPPPNAVVAKYPPDVLLTAMGAREEGFQGGTGTYIAWPDIVPMWFNYRNLVSGRVPQYYQPDCTACTVRPDWSMTNYGYEMPPNGPEIDGLNVTTGQQG
jgi:hypothetical protein